MTDYDTLLIALKAPVLPITILGPAEARAQLANPEVKYVSEWKHVVGTVRYEYRLHGDEGELLKALHKRGVRGGNPWLTNVSSRKELEAIAWEETCVH
ncbi:Uncharacterised protein [uncultured archaeon]|nr:Uncharacterised protein [uncultured archaeon]